MSNWHEMMILCLFTLYLYVLLFFFFNGTSPTEIYTLSLHDALPILVEVKRLRAGIRAHRDSSGHELCWHHPQLWGLLPEKSRSEEHTSELQSHHDLVCRLLLEKKKEKHRHEELNQFDRNRIDLRHLH